MLHNFHKQQSSIAETLQLSILLSCLNCLRLSPSFMHKLKTATPLNQMFYTKLLWWLFCFVWTYRPFCSPESTCRSTYQSVGQEKISHFCGISCFCYFNGLKTKQSRSGETSQQAVFILKEKKLYQEKVLKRKVKLCDNCICYIVICTEKQLTASCKLMSSCTIL